MRSSALPVYELSPPASHASSLRRGLKSLLRVVVVTT